MSDNTRVFAQVTCLMPGVEAVQPDGSVEKVYLRSLGKYLAEYDADAGLWRLFPALGHNTGLYAPLSSCCVTTAMLESYRFDHTGVVEEDEPSCFFAGLVTGKTYEVREELKALGGKWMPEERAWAVPLAHWHEAQGLVQAQDGQGALAV